MTTSSETAEFATSYHAAATMVYQRNALNIHGVKHSMSASDILEDYLERCQRLNIYHHNDVWEKDAYKVVDEIEAKSKVSIDRMLGRKKS